MNYTGKVYVSKKGRKFGITNAHRPSEGDVVFFTRAEFDWMKSQNLAPDEFEALWLLKRDDFRYNPIPQEETDKAIGMAEEYCMKIRAKLMGVR